MKMNKNIIVLLLLVGAIAIIALGFLLAHFGLDFAGLEIISGLIVLALSLNATVITWKARNDELWEASDQVFMLAFFLLVASLLLFAGVLKY